MKKLLVIMLTVFGSLLRAQNAVQLPASVEMQTPKIYAFMLGAGQGASGTAVLGFNASSSTVACLTTNIAGSTCFSTTLAWQAGRYISNVATGTAPLTITSTTPVANLTLSTPQQAQVYVAALVTTAAASDNVAITGATASSHCGLTATNASAATNTATTYISAKTTNQITVTHTATASMNYDVICTSN